MTPKGPTTKCPWSRDGRGVAEVWIEVLQGQVVQVGRLVILSRTDRTPPVVVVIVIIDINTFAATDVLVDAIVVRIEMRHTNLF